VTSRVGYVASNANLSKDASAWRFAAGIVKCPQARKTKTTYRITVEGRRALTKYLKAMRQLLDVLESSSGQGN